MKAFLARLLFALAFAPTLLAETAAFDIATFVPPKGWNQTQSPGVLVLQDRKSLAGREVFCQIYLFASRPSAASPQENFRADWDAKIAGPLRVNDQPSPQSETTPDGWKTMTAYADLVWQGVPMRAILVNATGFGKSISVVVTVSPNSYQAELEKFFQDLNFKVRPEEEGPSAPAGPPTSSSPGAATPGGESMGSYIYKVPEGWTRQESPQRTVLTSPAYSNGERCQLTLLPLRPSSGPLADDALGTFRALFSADPLMTYPSPPPKLSRGTSPQGWEYFLIRRLIGGQEFESRTLGAILLEAKVGGQVATVAGLSKDFIASSCFGLLQPDAWPKFFYSLQFKDAQPSGQEEKNIRQQLAGSWITATSSVGLQFTFTANGRYASTGATQMRSRISSSEVLETTRAYFGDGAYAFDGNTLVLKRDDQTRTTYFFSLHQASKDAGKTWTDELCLLDPSSTGEVCYQKE